VIIFGPVQYVAAARYSRQRARTIARPGSQTRILNRLQSRRTQRHHAPRACYFGNSGFARLNLPPAASFLFTRTDICRSETP
jgi:hypothetical protein